MRNFKSVEEKHKAKASKVQYNTEDTMEKLRSVQWS